MKKLVLIFIIIIIIIIIVRITDIYVYIMFTSIQKKSRVYHLFVCFLVCWTWRYCYLLLRFCSMRSFYVYSLFYTFVFWQFCFSSIHVRYYYAAYVWCMTYLYFSFLIWIHLFIEVNCLKYIDIVLCFLYTIRYLLKDEWLKVKRV